MDYLEQRRKLRQMVQERLDYGRDYTDEEVEDTIDEVLMEQENLELCSVELRRRLRKELFDSLRRLDILQIFVDDSSVTEIMINGLDHIFVERDGQLQELDRAFDSMEKLQDVIQQIVAGCNRVVNEAYVVETGEYGTHGNGSAASGDPQPDSIRRGYYCAPGENSG